MSYHQLSGAPSGAADWSYPKGLTEGYWKTTSSSIYRKPVSYKSGPVADQCNESIHPAICQYAKTQRREDGTWASFLGKKHPTQDEFRLWERWSPPGDEPLAEDAKTGEVEVAGGVSDVVFYGGIAAAAVLVGGLLWYARR